MSYLKRAEKECVKHNIAKFTIKNFSMLQEQIQYVLQTQNR